MPRERDAKMAFDIILAIVYGFFFVNYIDAVGPRSGPFTGWYHAWLVGIYFIPFLLLAPDWSRVLALGLLASLMNDGLWGPWHVAFSGWDASQLSWWAYHWYVPTDVPLFTLLLGPLQVTAYGWMMALSIYARIGLVVYLLAFL